MCVAYEAITDVVCTVDVTADEEERVTGVIFVMYAFPSIMLGTIAEIGTGSLPGDIID